MGTIKCITSAASVATLRTSKLRYPHALFCFKFREQLITYTALRVLNMFSTALKMPRQVFLSTTTILVPLTPWSNFAKMQKCIWTREKRYLYLAKLRQKYTKYESNRITSPCTKHVDSHLVLNSLLLFNFQNVIAVHCKAGKGRTGLVLCCYMQFTEECKSPEEALAVYGHARTQNGKGVTIPSQIRWVHYFGEYLKKYRRADPPRPFPLGGLPIEITCVKLSAECFPFPRLHISACHQPLPRTLVYMLCPRDNTDPKNHFFLYPQGHKSVRLPQHRRCRFFEPVLCHISHEQNSGNFIFFCENRCSRFFSGP